MISRVAVLFLSFAFASGTFAQNRNVPAEAPVEAVISRITGTILFRQGPQGSIQKLKKSTDQGKHLRAGDELKVEPGGEVIIQIFGEQKQKVITERLGWFPIPNRRLIIAAQPVGPEVKSQFGRAGRRRGSSNIILSPLRQGVVRPSTLVFRWLPLKDTEVSLSVRLTRDSKTLWSQSNIDGMSGQFTSEPARKSLRKIQKKNMSRYIEFTLMSSKAHRVLFRVMSLDEEQLLSRELRKWEGMVEFTRNIGRAYTFSRYRLYDEAAAEYESALADSPESIDLLRMTIRANCRAGNKIRAEELAKRLPTNQVLSDQCVLAIK